MGGSRRTGFWGLCRVGPFIPHLCVQVVDGMDEDTLGKVGLEDSAGLANLA